MSDKKNSKINEWIIDLSLKKPQVLILSNPGVDDVSVDLEDSKMNE